MHILLLMNKRGTTNIKIKEHKNSESAGPVIQFSICYKKGTWISYTIIKILKITYNIYIRSGNNKNIKLLNYMFNIFILVLNFTFKYEKM